MGRNRIRVPPESNSEGKNQARQKPYQKYCTMEDHIAGINPRKTPREPSTYPLFRNEINPRQRISFGTNLHQGDMHLPPQGIAMQHPPHTASSISGTCFLSDVSKHVVCVQIPIRRAQLG